MREQAEEVSQSLCFTATMRRARAESLLPSHPVLDAKPAKENDKRGCHKEISVVADANRRRLPLRLLREDTI